MLGVGNMSNILHFDNPPNASWINNRFVNMPTKIKKEK